MDLAYVAHSERCALLLDRDGVCRWVVPKVDESDESLIAARRCIGAQFVASLDPEEPGLLGSQARVGASLLFAPITDGRVTLVRFGPLQSFEKLDAPVEGNNDVVTSAAPLPVDHETRTSSEDESTQQPVDDAPHERPSLLSQEARTPPTLSSIQAPAPEASELLATSLPDDTTDEDDLITVSRPAANDANDANDASTATFVRESAAPIAHGGLAEDHEASGAVDLEATFDRLASGGPLEPGSSPASSLPLALVMPITPAVEAGYEPLSDSDIDEVATTAFAREDRHTAPMLPDLREGVPGLSELDVEVDTSSFARLPSDDIPESRTPPMSEPPVRPSGFMIRATALRAEGLEAVEGDLATRRFSRAMNGAPPIPRHDGPPATSRGMLPRR